MSPRLQILRAEIRCFFYLLFVGMWRGEHECKHYAPDGKLLLIYTAKRIPLPGWQVKKIFWRMGK